MKAIIFAIFGFLSVCAYGQAIDTVEVSTSKTTYILLDSDVNLVDIGTKEFVGIPKENMVILKAIRENAAPTSLMVRTKTGVHVWMLKYAANPKQILINKQTYQSAQPLVQTNATKIEAATDKSQLPYSKPGQPAENKGYQSAQQYDQRNIERYGNEEMPSFIQVREDRGNRHVDVRDPMMQKKFFHILKQKRTVKDVGEISNGIYFMLQNVFVDREHLYLTITINNTSSISFDLDFISFERKQGKTFKRKEALSTMMLDVQHYETVYSVAPSTEENLVYAIKLFALQDTDTVLVKLNEIGGVRTINFTIPAKLITTAKSL